ncbi:hypothetical protein [Pandoraea apista]|uniref:hypothetical protein n=1 Tax=Pandoraea apista TaxID=93218 RepID=UPI00163A4377|nr:hypothetical protein [Pandoraea apista]
MSRSPLRKWIREGVLLLLGTTAALAFLAVLIVCLGYMTAPDFQSDDTPNYEKTI